MHYESNFNNEQIYLLYGHVWMVYVSGSGSFQHLQTNT
jgi:hypothetical protein